MAVIETSWSMWFWTMSRIGSGAARRTPARPSIPSDSATVIWTWSTNWRFQIGSKIPFANRRTSMFWTVSLPR